MSILGKAQCFCAFLSCLSSYEWDGEMCLPPERRRMNRAFGTAGKNKNQRSVGASHRALVFVVIGLIE